MSRERYTAGYAPSQSRTPRARIATVLCLLIAAGFVFLSATGHPLGSKIKRGLLDVVTPVVEWVSTPITGIRNLMDDKSHLFAAYEENKQLREETEALRRWQSVAQALKAENDSLRALAGYQPVEESKYITARVIGQSPDNLSASLTINAGEEANVQELQPVIDAYGLIGRVTELADHHSRVLLLTDSNSKIPVVTADSRIHGILVGTGGELMRLTFLGADSEKIPVGESVVTTEEGKLIPGGIAVGSVFKRDKQGLYVKASRPLAQSEYVRVIISK